MEKQIQPTPTSFQKHKQIYTACITVTQLVHSKTALIIGSINKNYYTSEIIHAIIVWPQNLDPCSFACKLELFK